MIKTIVSSIACLLLFLVPCSAETFFGDLLSPEEKEWLRVMDGKIRLAPDPYFPPMEFFDEQGVYRGIAADYVRIIEQKTGISFKIVRLGDFEEILEKAANLEIDMVATVIETPERSEYLSFTRPYIRIPNVIVVSDNISINLSVEDLSEMHDVVYQGGYSIGPYLMQEHGLYHIRPITHPGQALRELSTGQIQAMVGNLGVISHHIREMNLPNLRVAGDCGYDDVLSFAARSDWPMLIGILDKVLEDISQDERRAIENEWIGLSLPMFYHDSRFWLGVSGLTLIFLLLLALFYAWNRTLKKQVALRTAAHKQAREDLADEVLRRRLLVEQSRDGIVVLDEEGGVYEANRQFADMLGYEMEDCMRLYVWDWDEQWSRQELLDMLRKVDSSGERFETRFRRKDGVLLNVEISTNGAVIKGKKYIFCVCRNITERKQAEKEREKLQAQLLQAQKMESVGILAGGMAHDFNNLLHVISGNLQLLRKDNPEHHPNTRRIKVIEKSVERAGQLVSQLLLFSRKSEVRKKTLDLNREVTEVVQILKRTIPKMIEIRVDLGKNIRPFNADPVQIQQVLLNLGSNAADAMPLGGKLVIETGNLDLDGESSHVDLGLKPGPYVLLSVSDTGTGMDKETLSRIFDPFFTTKEVGKGTGLGLPTAYGIVRVHQGLITCDSEPGHGTTFRIYLPAAKPGEIDPVEKEAHDPASPGGNATILLVDDEDEVRELTHEVLESSGYSLLSAGSAEEALDIYRKSKEIDLVIMDLNMPGMGGLQGTRELIRLDPEARILISSGYTAHNHGHDALDAGAKDFMSKPFQMNQLLAKIREMLGGK